MAASTSVDSGGQDVLLVADQPAAERWTGWLRDRWHAVQAAATDAPGRFDAEPHVAVIDRSCSGIHADRLVGIVDERGLSTRVVLLTDVEPAPDPGRLGFDEYVVKPVDREGLVAAVEGALRRARYLRRLAAFYRLADERAAARAGSVPHAADGDRWPELRAARRAAAEAFEQLEREDVRTLYRDHFRRERTVSPGL